PSPAMTDTAAKNRSTKSSISTPALFCRDGRAAPRRATTRGDGAAAERRPESEGPTAAALGLPVRFQKPPPHAVRGETASRVPASLLGPIAPASRPYSK